MTSDEAAAKIIGIRPGLEPLSPQPNETIVRFLEDALQEARDGDITAVSIISLHRAGGTSHRQNAEGANVMALIGRLCVALLETALSQIPHGSGGNSPAA